MIIQTLKTDAALDADLDLLRKTKSIRVVNRAFHSMNGKPTSITSRMPPKPWSITWDEWAELSRKTIEQALSDLMMILYLAHPKANLRDGDFKFEFRS